MIGPTMRETVTHPPKRSIGKAVIRENVGLPRNSGSSRKQRRRLAAQAASLPATMTATKKPSPREKGKTRSGPIYENTPIGTRTALIMSKRWKAASVPRRLPALITKGRERARR